MTSWKCRFNVKSEIEKNKMNLGEKRSGLRVSKRVFSKKLCRLDHLASATKAAHLCLTILFQRPMLNTCVLQFLY